MKEWKMWVIGIIIVYIFTLIITYTVSLPQIHECNQLKEVGLDTISELRFGLFWIPYNYCGVKIDNRYYSASSWDNDDIIYGKIEQPLSENENKIKNSVIINGDLK